MATSTGLLVTPSGAYKLTIDEIDAVQMLDRLTAHAIRPDIFVNLGALPGTKGAVAAYTVGPNKAVFRGISCVLPEFKFTTYGMQDAGDGLVSPRFSCREAGVTMQYPFAVDKAWPGQKAELVFSSIVASTADRCNIMLSYLHLVTPPVGNATPTAYFLRRLHFSNTFSDGKLCMEGRVLTSDPATDVIATMLQTFLDTPFNSDLQPPQQEITSTFRYNGVTLEQSPAVVTPDDLVRVVPASSVTSIIDVLAREVVVPSWK